MDRNATIAIGIGAGGVMVGGAIVVAALLARARTADPIVTQSVPTVTQEVMMTAEPLHQAAPANTAAPDFMSMAEYQYDKENAEAFCREEWTKRGELNTHMFNYCVGQEHDGYRDIPATLKKYGHYLWMTTLFPAIWTKWTKRGITQYRMVGYELKKEADKFLDYQYERKQQAFDADKMSGCLEKWADSESRWSMTMHCYKHD